MCMETGTELISPGAEHFCQQVRVRPSLAVRRLHEATPPTDHQPTERGRLVCLPEGRAPHSSARTRHLFRDPWHSSSFPALLGLTASWPHHGACPLTTAARSTLDAFVNSHCRAGPHRVSSPSDSGGQECSRHAHGHSRVT